MSDFEQYIGKPWEAWAEGPDSYDCAALFRVVQRDHFGIDVSRVIVPDYDDALALVGMIEAGAQEQGWTPVKEPRHGDLVIVHRPRHVGVWIETPTGPGVLHCVRGASVVFTRNAAWQASGFGRKQFLRHRSKMDV
jgi:cell wall-associated NlpC family hydrolase